MTNDIEMVDIPVISAYAGGASPGGVGSTITILINGKFVQYIPAPARAAELVRYTPTGRGLMSTSDDGPWVRFEAVRQLLAATPLPPSLPAAQQAEPLTPERIMHLKDIHVGDPTAGTPIDMSDWLVFARAVEAEVLAAHNISAAPAGEGETR